MSYDAYPAARFHSTSSYTPVVGTTSYTSEVYEPGADAPHSGMYKAAAKSPWDKPTGPGVGEMDTPVGEPLILLVFALLYLLGKWKGRKIALFG